MLELDHPDSQIDKMNNSRDCSLAPNDDPIVLVPTKDEATAEDKGTAILQILKTTNETKNETLGKYHTEAKDKLKGKKQDEIKYINNTDSETDFDNDYEEVNEEIESAKRSSNPKKLTWNFPKYAQVNKKKKDLNMDNCRLTRERSQGRFEDTIKSDEDEPKVDSGEEELSLERQDVNLFYDYAPIDKTRDFDIKFKPGAEYHEYAQVDKAKKKKDREEGSKCQEKQIPIYAKVDKKNRAKKEIVSEPTRDFPEYAQVDLAKKLRAARTSQFDAVTSQGIVTGDNRGKQDYQALEEKTRELHIYQKLVH